MLWWFAQTTLIAGALAVVATLAGRWKRLGPEARHVLWLLVLIKLAIPPFVAWPWSVPDAWPARVEPVEVSVAVPVPTSAPAPLVEPVAIPTPDALPTPSPDPLPVATTPPSPEEVLAGVEVAEDFPRSTISDPSPIEPPAEVRDPAPLAQGSETSNLKSQIGDLKSKPWDWNLMILAAWLTGSSLVVARRGFKVFRFHRSLADSTPAPDWLVDETRVIGDRVGVRPPPVVATPQVATPLLWCLGRPRLILPEVLIKRLGVNRWPGILAHELAHLARGDHWVVRLELLVEAAWWWNPLFWLARRKLHEEAEIACDARVVRALPERRYAYAEALVDVCEHIARAAIPSPSLGVGGAGAAHSLEGRLHMILRDPIPHRPTRRATLLALFLAALALPAWTLGQQPEVPAARPAAPAAKPEDPFAPRPDPQPTPSPAPQPVPEPVPQLPPGSPPPSITIEAIVAAQAKAREGLGNLLFRYVVASRDQSHTSRGRGGMGGGMGGMGGGMGGVGGGGGMGGGMGGVGGGGGVRGAAGQGFPAVNAMGGIGGGRAPGQAALTIQRAKTVHVQVADVILGSGGHYRLDMLDARPASGAAPAPARPLAWNRRFVAHDGGGYTTLEMAWDRTGPVPFRWTGGGGNGWETAWGDSLTTALLGGPNGRAGLARAIDQRRLDPFDPRPANVLDLTGMPIPFLDAKTAHAEVVAMDTIDGREVVRVAWIGKDNTDANGDIGLRGLCWLAPELGYAVVRSDATLDPSQGAGQGRRSWRKRSSDFVKVANLWLPRKVSYEESQADPYSDGDPLRRREQEMTFEDYRVAPALTADTFRPKLAIQTLDDLSGNFTAMPPEVPAGLVDRLTKAVAESKFGPPIVERIIEEPKEAAAQPGGPGRQPFELDPVPSQSQPGAAGKPGNKPNPAPGQSRPGASGQPGNQPNPAPRVSLSPGVLLGTVPGAPTRLDSRFAPVDDPAKADPNIIAQPAPGFKDLIPTLDPKVDDPFSARAPSDRAEIDRTIERRFSLDPEVVALATQMKEASKKLDEARRVAARPNDAAEIRARRAFDNLKAKYLQLWEEKSGEIRKEFSSDPARTRDEIEVLQARRDGKLAELRKAEAQRDMAVLERDNTLKLRKANGVSDGEVALFEGKLKITEAELASKKAGLDEADALLNQAKRRLGIATVAEPATDPVADPFARPPLANGSKNADRDLVGLDARDEVEFRQARRDGKAAELQKAETRLEQAKLDLKQATSLLDKLAIGQNEFEQAKTNLRLAEGDLTAKKAELTEADVFLNQARRRLSGHPTASFGSSSPGERPATLAELRDTVELMEVQLQGKQAELRGVEAKFDSAKAFLDARKPLSADGRITQILWAETETNLKLAQAELEAKKAEVLEAEVRIKQAKRRIAEPATSTPTQPPADPRDAVELVEAQLQGKQAELRKVQAMADLARREATNAKRMAAKGSVSNAEVDLYNDKAEAAQGELDAKKAEVLEYEIRLKQAKRRLEPGEALLKRDIERAKDRLNWSKDMEKKGYVPHATVVADQLTYDELMIQLDPKYVPAPAAEGRKPNDQSRKEKEEAGPRLSVKLIGEKARVSGQVNEYKLTVTNTGTAQAKKVQVVASLPQQGGKLREVKEVASLPQQGGKLIEKPGGAKFDPATRKLSWLIAELDSSKSVEMVFAYDSTTPGLYKAIAEATSGDLQASDTLTTEVSSIAALDVQLTQTARVLDVGKNNFYDIIIKNSGTKDATKLQLTGKLSKNLKILKHFNGEKGELKFNPDSGEFIFPEIESLGAGVTTTLSLEIQATKSGPANCHVFLTHAEMGAQEAKVEEVISTTVTGAPVKSSSNTPIGPEVAYFTYFIGAFW